MSWFAFEWCIFDLLYVTYTSNLYSEFVCSVQSVDPHPVWTVLPMAYYHLANRSSTASVMTWPWSSWRRPNQGAPLSPGGREPPPRWKDERIYWRNQEEEEEEEGSKTLTMKMKKRVWGEYVWRSPLYFSVFSATAAAAAVCLSLPQSASVCLGLPQSASCSADSHLFLCRHV